jgi:hypothetical protein
MERDWPQGLNCTLAAGFTGLASATGLKVSYPSFVILRAMTYEFASSIAANSLTLLIQRQRERY